MSAQIKEEYLSKVAKKVLIKSKGLDDDNWLEEHFEELGEKLSDCGIDIDLMLAVTVIDSDSCYAYFAIPGNLYLGSGEYRGYAIPAKEYMSLDGEVIDKIAELDKDRLNEDYNPAETFISKVVHDREVDDSGYVIRYILDLYLCGRGYGEDENSILTIEI